MTSNYSLYLRQACAPPFVTGAYTTPAASVHIFLDLTEHEQTYHDVAFPNNVILPQFILEGEPFVELGDVAKNILQQKV